MDCFIVPVGVRTQSFLLNLARTLILGLALMCVDANIIGQQTLKIMPLGNSLTAGENGDPSNPLTSEQMVAYRYGLKYLLEQEGYSIDFVGSQSDGSAYFSDNQHAAIPGSRDQYVERLLIDGYDQRNGVQILNPPRLYLDEFNPDIILLHIGTNDVTHETDIITNERVSAILDLIDQYEARAGKEVTVFLALIINRRLPCSTGSGCWTTTQFNNYIETMAQSRIASGDKIVLVDMENDADIVYTNEDFTAADPQGLHLNPNGYGKMAAKWFSSIVSYYNSGPTISPIPDQAIAEGGSFDVIALDNYVYDLEDPDSDITWTYQHLTTSNLSVSINASRQATIAPVDPFWSGSESIIFTATDKGVNGGFIKSTSDTVNFSISSVNNPPVVTGQQDLSVEEDNSITISISDFTIFDPDAGQSPENQSMAILSGDHYTIDGNTITPSPDYDSDIYVRIAVSDEVEQGPVYDALVNVIPVNDPPVCGGQSPISIDEDQTYIVSLTELSASDIDNPDNELSVVMKAGNNHTCDGNQIIPAADFWGMLFIETNVVDISGAKSNTINLQVEVRPINDPPEFTTEPIDTARVSNAYIYPFNATDPDNSFLDFTIVQKPDWLIHYVNSKILAGTPEVKDMGTAVVKIRVSDGTTEVDQNFYISVSSITAVGDVATAESAPSIYPNPVLEHFTLDNRDHLNDAVFEIYGSSGRLIFKQVLNGGEVIHFNVNERDMQPGIYFYSIRSKQNHFTGKLILQNH